MVCKSRVFGQIYNLFEVNEKDKNGVPGWKSTAFNIAYDEGRVF